MCRTGKELGLDGVLQECRATFIPCVSKREVMVRSVYTSCVFALCHLVSGDCGAGVVVWGPRRRLRLCCTLLVKMEDAPKLLKSRNVQTFGFVYHDTNGQNHGPVWKT